ncbi:MAG: thiamine phosphate synthase [Spirochaetes bacterium]|nr:thiamine phosphate synthase [Spirochaetota bacterium]
MDKGLYSVIDACLNRALEGLRVGEDLLRFHYRTATFSSKLKGLRHDIAAAASCFPYHDLLEGRDVPGDGQKFVAAGAADERISPEEALRANLHRSMEAVRTLEELSKVLPEARGASGRFQEIRFSLYHLEREIVLAVARGGRLGQLASSLYGILDSAFVTGAYDTAARRMINGGARVLQLRMKDAPSGEFYRTAVSVSGVCREEGTLFIVNDRPDIASLAGADGVHLGQEDLPVREARRILPDAMIVGLSISSMEQARAAAADPPDYIAVGPLFGTTSKTGGPLAAIGTDVIAQIKAEIDIPIVGIGGITAESAAQCIRAGCTSLAAISELYKNGEIEKNCELMVRSILAAAGRDS